MNVKLLVLLIEPAVVAVLLSWFLYSVYFSPRRRKFRRLMREFNTANRRHRYYMSEGDLARAREQLDVMGKIVDQESRVL